MNFTTVYKRTQKMETKLTKEKIMKVYLLTYNMVELIGFAYMLVVMLSRYAILGYESVTDMYAHVGWALKIVQPLQFMEVLHPFLDSTRFQTDLWPPIIQATGRNFVLCLIDAEPRVQSISAVFYVLLAWSTIDFIRHMYYVLQLFKKNVSLIKWLRYTLWIPLYPIGVGSESIVLFKNIFYFQETQRFSISMPNSWNLAFQMPILMSVDLVISVFTFFILTGHMYKLRTKKINI